MRGRDGNVTAPWFYRSAARRDQSDQSDRSDREDDGWGVGAAGGSRDGGVSPPGILLGEHDGLYAMMYIIDRSNSAGAGRPRPGYRTMGVSHLARYIVT